jgi:hypothetical protein
MRKLIPLKTVSQIILLIMLVVTINGVHESAHATQTQVVAESDQVASTDIAPTHQCPCSPFEQHSDYDGCDTCLNCACHAPLSIKQFRLQYNPIILDLDTLVTFNYFPEVYLSLFVPPDSATI